MISTVISLPFRSQHPANRRNSSSRINRFPLFGTTGAANSNTSRTMNIRLQLTGSTSSLTFILLYPLVQILISIHMQNCHLYSTWVLGSPLKGLGLGDSCMTDAELGWPWREVCLSVPRLKKAHEHCRYVVRPVWSWGRWVTDELHYSFTFLSSRRSTGHTSAWTYLDVMTLGSISAASVHYITSRAPYIGFLSMISASSLWLHSNFPEL